MTKNILLYLVFIASCFAFFTNIKVGEKRMPFSLGGATERDKLMEIRNQMMLADPATGKIPDHIRAKELEFYNKYILPNQAKATRGNPWTSAGPWNVGGRTRACAFDKTNENIIIAGGVSSGIWRTTNGGTSWIQVSNLAGYLGVTSISQDKRAGKENIWYASTGEGAGNSASGGTGSYYFGDGLFKSIDSGKSWQPITTTSASTPNSFSNPLQITWRVRTHPSTDSDFVYVATYGTITKSNDGGTTWKTVLGNFAGATVSYYTDVEITSTGIIYATLSSDGPGKGFYRSADNGLTWANITPDSFNTYGRTVMGVNPNDENEVYFFTYMPDNDSSNVWSTKTSNYQGESEWISLLKYKYISGDGTDTGGTWTNLSPNLPNNANATSGPFDKLNCQGGYDMCVAVQPVTGAVFIAGTNIFRGNDGFTTPNNFAQIGGYKIGTTLPHFEIWLNHHPDNHDLMFYPSDYKKLLSASDGGVRMTTDANSNTTTVWTTLNNGYITSQLYSVTLDPTPGSHWLLAGFQDNGNFITNDYYNQQKIWAFPFNGDGAHNYIAPNRDFYVMSIQLGVVAKFQLDNNGNPIAFNRIDPIGPKKNDYGFINALAVDPNDNDILYLPAGKYLYRQNSLKSLPLSGNWDSISTGWFKLTDSIKTLNLSNGYRPEITCIAVSKSPANTVYIGTSNRDVYRIDNAHTGNPSFIKINKPTMNGYVSDIAIDPEDSKKVLVAYSNYNSNALFYSTSGGDTFNFCFGNLKPAANNYSGAAPSLRAVKILKTNTGGRKYYLGTSVGLYSTDTLKHSNILSKDSTVWVQEGINTIGTNVVTHIDVRQEDYVVAVGTHGGGAFISEQFWPLKINNTLGVLDVQCDVYPNPARENCNIALQLQNATQIKIYIVDMFGRKINMLANGQMIEGKHNFVCQTQKLQNGMYNIVIEDAIGKKLSKKLIVAH